MFPASNKSSFRRGRESTLFALHMYEFAAPVGGTRVSVFKSSDSYLRDIAIQAELYNESRQRWCKPITIAHENILCLLLDLLNCRN